MEIQFQHHHVLTFCDQNKENFSHILFKFFKRDERNRRKVDGDLEVAELDDEEECAELDDEEKHAELDDEEHAELDDEEVCAELDDEEEHAELDDEECAELDDEEECAELDDEEEHTELDDDEERAELDDEEEPTELDDEEEHAELDDEEDYPECCVCSKIVDDGPVYFCEMCDGIWVHKSCAYLPLEIRAHPLHLQHDHPLTLLAQQITDELLHSDSGSSFNGKVHICDGCMDITISGNYYACAECGLKLDVKCALSLQVSISTSPDTKTSISHHSHDHKLFLFNFNKEMFLDFQWNRDCGLCDKELLDLTYGCFRCRFYLHKRCLEITQQECLILPIHSHHPLSMEYRHGLSICDQCRDLCGRQYIGHFMAICKECGLKFDYKCAFISDTTIDTIQRSIKDEVKTQIRYFDHDLHMLSFFNLRNNFPLDCEGCGLMLSGPSYGCLECKVYLHKSCAELPPTIQHPYHPSHNLFLENGEGFCRACRKNVKSLINPKRKPANSLSYRKDAKSLIYRCHWCPFFSLDTKCVINNLGVISAFKNKEYHRHDLYYFVASDSDGSYNIYVECLICEEDCEGAFYICLECNSYFHMECIGILKEVKHDSHMHPLTLMDPLTEDEIDESKDQYYCYTCEEKRNPRYHAYSCQQCAKTGHIFTSHIECVLSSELNEIEHNHMIKKDNEEDSHGKFTDLCQLSISPRCMKQLLIKDKLKDHVLNYFEDSNFQCYLCMELVQSPHYECSFCGIHLHKECAKLPSKIKHNLHEHPLSIKGGEFLKTYICDGCHVYHEIDMCYYCEECSFFLDMMCAQTTSTIGNHYPKLNDNGSKVGFSHFSHNHKLRFAFIPEKLEIKCSACRFLISGPTYCCYACYFFLHESCFDELKPQYIKHPFHIQHPLHFKVGVICKACTSYSNIGYQCAEGYECAKGSFQLDIKCVKYLTSGLQHKYHEHKLFCFVAEDINDDMQCKHCDQTCNAFFYRCLDCNVNLHIECMAIPKNVKSVCHVHPLTLMDSINEEGQDEYYCHACENLRNPKHAAYYCKKCYYTAHIGCVLDEEEGEIEIL